MGKRGDGARYDPHGWWRPGCGETPRTTPDGDLVPRPNKVCTCAGQGLTVPGIACGAGFETAAAWCLLCAHSQLRGALDYALGLDVLKAEGQGDNFYNRKGE